MVLHQSHRRQSLEGTSECHRWRRFLPRYFLLGTVLLSSGRKFSRGNTHCELRSNDLLDAVKALLLAAAPASARQDWGDLPRLPSSSYRDEFGVCRGTVRNRKLDKTDLLNYSTKFNGTGVNSQFLWDSLDDDTISLGFCASRLEAGKC